MLSKIGTTESSAAMGGSAGQYVVAERLPENTTYPGMQSLVGTEVQCCRQRTWLDAVGDHVNIAVLGRR